MYLSFYVALALSAKAFVAQFCGNTSMSTTKTSDQTVEYVSSVPQTKVCARAAVSVNKYGGAEKRRYACIHAQIHVCDSIRRPRLQQVELKSPNGFTV